MPAAGVDAGVLVATDALRGTGGTLRGETMGARIGERRAGAVVVAVELPATETPGRGDVAEKDALRPALGGDEAGGGAAAALGREGEVVRGGLAAAENVTYGMPEATTTK